MSYNKDIAKLFRDVYITDKEKYIKPWMVSWDYQDIRNKRKVKYDKGLPEDFYSFNGPEDIVEWFKWQDVPKPDYFDDSIVKPLIQKSRSFDLKLFEQHSLDFNMDFYDEHLARNNAQDFILANFYPMNNPSSGQRILDFGAGYGRQFNLWSQTDDQDLTFVAIDGIPKSYCLQHVYYSNSSMNNSDYVITKEEFNLDHNSKGVFHLPTWRFDLIPDNYFDKIIVVQVLQELNEQLVKYVISQFNRILKPKGVLYIRDHMNAWRPTHKLDVDKYLAKNNFTLEFKPHIVDKRDLHGVPRLWRKTDPEVSKQNSISTKQKLIEVKNSIDAKSGGKLKSIVKKVLNKK